MGARRLQWESPQVSHICLALDLKSSVDCRGPFFIWRGKRLSGEIANRSLCVLCLCCNLVIYVLRFEENKSRNWNKNFIWMWNVCTVMEVWVICPSGFNQQTNFTYRLIWSIIAGWKVRRWWKKRYVAPSCHVMHLSRHHNYLNNPQKASTGHCSAVSDKKEKKN